jgi:hypothetical protein
MKILSTGIAALALLALMIAGPATEAKADGGAVAIGVGAYLITDAIVGHKCHRNDWPFNLVSKLADEIHGRKGCHRHVHHRKHRHHHKRKHR